MINSYKTTSSPSPASTNSKVCSLNISIGNLNQVGDKLASTIEWANKHFDKAIINLGDTLQRHNLMALGEINHHNKSKYLGDIWLKDNEAELKYFEIPYEIKRWDDWLCMDKVQRKISLARQIYASDEMMAESLLTDAVDYADRFARGFSDHHVDFILEEIGVHSYMAEAIQGLAFVYPSNRMRCYEYLSNHLAGDIIGLNKAVFIRSMTKKRKDRKPSSIDVKLVA